MESITKAVVPAAGLGTRLLSVTKEQPKEMLGVFAPGADGVPYLKPVVQLIFEQLYDCGIREFCFVVGRGKRAIEDHFTPDWGFVRLLKSRGKGEQARDLVSFYRRVEGSTVLWMNQADPKGFGHAVLSAKAISDGDPVLVHAGDNHVISPGNAHLKRLLGVFREAGPDAAILLRKVDDPRQYGVAVVTRRGEEIVVRGVMEKPERPTSKLALLPTYVFRPTIFDALESIGPGRGGEMQLTDGIQEMIRRGLRVRATLLKKDEYWLDVGTPEAYWRALKTSYSRFVGR